jgi:hypothetical protein
MDRARRTTLRKTPIEQMPPWKKQGGQNGHPTRPQPTTTPQAYPLGYVEDVAEARTPLGAVFTTLMISG